MIEVSMSSRNSEMGILSTLEMPVLRMYFEDWE